MSDTPAPSTPPAPDAPPPVAAPQDHPERLYQAAAWVAIIAGVLLIALVVLRFVWFLSC